MGIFDGGVAERLVGAELPEQRRRWSRDDVVLYHLGIGVGIGGVGHADRRYLDERQLVVLPSFAATVAHATASTFDTLGRGLIDRRSSLHGEQEIRLLGPIPPEASVVTRGHVAAVRDLGRSALLNLETRTDTTAGTTLFTTRFAIVLRGAGGFAPERLPTSPAAARVTDEPDGRTRVTTSPRQAALYRLCGDKNPLHLDPEVAGAAGFDRPILHGLSTYGAVLRAIVDSQLDGDVNRVGSYTARFASPVFPGDALDVATWQTADGLRLEAQVQSRGICVLSGAVRDVGR